MKPFSRLSVPGYSNGSLCFGAACLVRVNGNQTMNPPAPGQALVPDQREQQHAGPGFRLVRPKPFVRGSVLRHPFPCSDWLKACLGMAG